MMKTLARLLSFVAILAFSAHAIAGVVKNLGVVPQVLSGGMNDVVVPNGHPFSVGSRVVATVDGPSGSDCIQAGDTGTLVCHDPNDNVFPYLVNWDKECGFPQSQVCGVMAPNGWWVGFDEVNVKLLATGVELTATKNGSGVDLTLTTSAEQDTAALSILRGNKLGNGGTAIGVACSFASSGDSSSGSSYTCTDAVVGDNYRVLETEYDGDIIVYDEVTPK